MQLGPGTRVAERYEVDREIARGGGAVIFRAHDQKFGVDVALKVATATGTLYDEFMARFRREARISYLLGKAPGFVRALDWGELAPGHTLYMTMDLVEGPRELDLGPERSTDDRLRDLVRAGGLVVRAHAQGVIHRDLKPANFLRGPGDELYLTDFGEAKSVADPPKDYDDVHRTRTGALIGTPLYMAPEQFNDARNVDYRADVYALGVMLYQCLTDRFPYEGRTAMQIMSRQVQTRHGDLPPPPTPRELDPDVNRALDRLCAAAISLAREGRPVTAGAFVEELQRCVGGDVDVDFGGAPWRPTQPPLPVEPSPAQNVWQRLGLDEEGFTTPKALRDERQALGREAFLELLGDSAALLACKERSVGGRKSYEGRIALLLSRKTGAPTGRVTVGRTVATDLTVNLVTTSKHHLTLVREPRGWAVIDEGSSNGTAVGADPLRPGELHPLQDGDRVALSNHVWLELYLPERLDLFLSSRGTAASRRSAR